MLSDVADKGSKGKGVAIEIEIAKPTTHEAASKIVAAIKSADAAALDDALHMWFAACEDSYGDDDEEEAGSMPKLPPMKGRKGGE